MPRLALPALLLLGLLAPACTSPPPDAASDLTAAVDGGADLDSGEGPPGPDVLQPVSAEAQDGLLRAYQDVDVTLDVPAAGRLRLELWSDGTVAEDAGNALSVTAQSDGAVAFSLRFGKEFVALDSARLTLPADRKLRLRLRLQPDGAALIYMDLRSGGAWAQQNPVFGVDNTRVFQGRRVVLVERPAGAPDPLVEPQLPAAALSFNRANDRMWDWKLYQRGPGGRADVPLSFAYRAEQGALLTVEVLRAADQAPLAGYPLQRFALPASPGRGARATLRAVPQGGNYLLRARMTEGQAPGGAQLGEDTMKEIAVGDVFLAIGQSNMTGFAPLQPAEEPTPSVHLFGNDYFWKQATEPMDSGENQVDRVSEEVPEHSLMLRFGKEISAAAGVPVAIIPGPRYGTSIEDWARRGDAPLGRGTLYGSAAYRVKLQNYGAPIRALLWYQGEGNAGSGVENYQRQMTQLIADLRSDLGGRPFAGLCQLSTNGEVMGEQGLFEYLQPQEAQRRYPQTDPQSAVVALVDLPRSDPYHLGNGGIKEAGARLARAVLAGSYGQPQKLGPALRSAALGGARDSIELTYDKAMSGGDAALFRARDDSGALGIASVTAAADKITVKLRRAVQGTALLSYGYSNDPAAKWLVGADGSGAALVFQDLPAK